MGKIKPMGRLKISAAGKTHIPILIRKEIGRRDIPYIVGSKTALLFDSTASVEDILKSIDILRADLLLRVQKEKRREK